MTRADLKRVVQAALDSHYERAVVVQDCEMAVARAVALAVLAEAEPLLEVVDDCTAHRACVWVRNTRRELGES